MTKNVKKIIIIIAILTLISVSINILYTLHIRLDEPIFVTKYKSISIQENGRFELPIEYIKNNNDKRQLVAIKFDGLDKKYDVFDDMSMWLFFDSNNNQPNKGRHYDRRSGNIYFEFDKTLIQKVDESNQLVLTNGTLYFDDQSTQEVEIGELLFHRWGDDKNLEASGSSGGSSGYSKGIEANGPLYLTGFDFSTYEAHKNDIAISILVDGNQAYTYEDLVDLKTPIEVKRKMEINYDMLNGNRNGEWRFDNICLKINYEKDGIKDVFRSYYSFGSNLVNDEYVEAYVKMRRAYD